MQVVLVRGTAAQPLIGALRPEWESTKVSVPVGDGPEALGDTLAINLIEKSAGMGPGLPGWSVTVGTAWPLAVLGMVSVRNC
jgi:hypothetical protein